MRPSWIFALGLSAVLSSAASGQRFAPPQRLEAAGEIINVEVGHAAPYLYDWDGDGDRDLFVGQFGRGRLRIYENVGSDKNPSYAKFRWFKAGGEIAQIPAG